MYEHGGGILGEGRCACSGEGVAQSLLEWAIQGALDNIDPGTGDFTVPLSSMITGYNRTLIESDESGWRSGDTLTVPTGKAGWHTISFWIDHPSDAIGTGVQESLADYNVGIKINDRVEKYSADSNSGMPEVGGFSIAVYLSVADTIELIINADMGRSNEDFLIRASIVSLNKQIGEIIRPVIFHGSSHAEFGGYTWADIFDSGDSQIDEDAGDIAFCSAVGDVRLVVNLGSELSINKFKYINFVYISGTSTNRGANVVNIYRGPNSWSPTTSYGVTAGLTLVYNGNLIQASGVPSVLSWESIVFGAALARYVVIDISSNHGDGTYTGLRAFNIFG